MHPLSSSPSYLIPFHLLCSVPLLQLIPFSSLVVSISYSVLSTLPSFTLFLSFLFHLSSFCLVSALSFLFPPPPYPASFLSSAAVLSLFASLSCVACLRGELIRITISARRILAFFLHESIDTVALYTGLECTVFHLQIRKAQRIMRSAHRCEWSVCTSTALPSNSTQSIHADLSSCILHAFHDPVSPRPLVQDRSTSTYSYFLDTFTINAKCI